MEGFFSISDKWSEIPPRKRESLVQREDFIHLAQLRLFKNFKNCEFYQAKYLQKLVIINFNEIFSLNLNENKAIEEISKNSRKMVVFLG